MRDNDGFEILDQENPDCSFSSVAQVLRESLGADALFMIRITSNGIAEISMSCPGELVPAMVGVLDHAHKKLKIKYFDSIIPADKGQTESQ